MYVWYIQSVYGMTLRYVSMIEEGYMAGLVCVVYQAMLEEGEGYKREGWLDT